jgi:argininosuccinate lyase
VVSAYAESLIDDITMLNAPDGCGPNPLGSAAGYGSSFPIDRTFTKRIGLRNPEIQCRCGANESRKSEKILAFAMSSVAATLAKFSMDVCLYMSQILISSLYQRI